MTKALSDDNFKKLARRLVADCLPNHLEEFDDEFDIKMAEARRPRRVVSEAGRHEGALEVASFGAAYLVLIFDTYKWIHKHGAPQTEAELAPLKEILTKSLRAVPDHPADAAMLAARAVTTIVAACKMLS